ncbi:TPA: transketolase [Candidatus Poribacteria bacterium]|nr:transketolase [Candidatus Poribacteria bacterium]
MSTDKLIAGLQDKADKLRIHSIRTTTKASSGHPTTCLSAADIVSALFFHAMRYDPHDHSNPNNDRFVLSKGHAAPLLYAAYAEVGAIPIEKLDTLREIDSELEGHPTPRFKWADVASGSLGQGLSIGVGMALNGKYLDKLDYRVYVLMGDGESAEGSVWEAAALSAHYNLDNLVGIVDVNSMGQSQHTMYEFDTESYRRRFEAFGWHTIVIDGHNMREILAALDEAKRTSGKPTMIVAKTLKGKGVSLFENKDGWHGKPIPAEDVEAALKELDKPEFDYEFKIESPPKREVNIDVAAASEMAPPNYQIGEEVATRNGFGTGLAKLGEVNPLVVSLDGDTKNSTYAQEFMEAHPDRYFECFIAEQNMVGAAVGLSSRGKIPFVSTFAAFLTRAFDHIRMSAISVANIKYVGSHCGISIGQDGPSQMGLEDLAMMRSIPNSVVVYPSDAVSAERLVAEVAQHKGIAYIRTSRPKTPVLYPNDEEFKIGGCKVLRSSDNDKVTVVAAGVTVHEALKAYETLKKEGVHIRVIDAYSVKPIDAETLRKSASETNNTIICVEDHYYDGGLGDAVLNAVAKDGVSVHKMAVKELPRSGKPEELMELYGINAGCIVKKVLEVKE